MNAGWNGQRLVDEVRIRHCANAADRLDEHIRSIQWKLYIAEYHADESIRILKECIYATPGVLPDDPESIAGGKAVLMAASDGSVARSFRLAQFKSGAHLIASAQSLHSLVDIMGFAVYWALNTLTRFGPIPNHKLTLGAVFNQIANEPSFSTVVSSIVALRSLPELDYLAAFVNTTKHRNILDVKYSSVLDPPFDERQGLVIEPFSYDDQRGTRSFQRKWGKDLLTTDRVVVADAVLAIGQSLNNHYKL